MGKNSIFQNIRSKISKVLKFGDLREIFSFNFLQAITFDTFMLANGNFLHMFYTGNTTGNKELNSHRLIQIPLRFTTKLGNNENSLI